MSGRLKWYAQRLSRMTPAEVLFRVDEQRRRWVDRRSAFGWESFDAFPGAISPLPGLDLELGENLLPQAANVRDRL